MKIVVRMNKWANARTSVPLDLLRITFGLFLFWKGLEFADQEHSLLRLMQPNYLAISHLAGGIFVVFGILTRLVLLLQMPMILIAVGMYLAEDPGYWNSVLGMIAFLAALFFFVVGPGKHSVDYNLKMNM